jgi:hypothetical protein
MPIPIIASDMTITSTSIVSHVGMRFAGWVIACPSAGTLCTERAQVAVNEFTCLDNRCRHRQAPASIAIALITGIPRFAANAPFRAMIFGELSLQSAPQRAP